MLASILLMASIALSSGLQTRRSSVDLELTTSMIGDTSLIFLRQRSSSPSRSRQLQAFLRARIVVLFVQSWLGKPSANS
jgi:hypothetical protein